MILRSLLVILTGFYFQGPSFRDNIVVYRMGYLGLLPNNSVGRETTQGTS